MLQIRNTDFQAASKADDRDVEKPAKRPRRNLTLSYSDFRKLVSKLASEADTPNKGLSSNGEAYSNINCKRITRSKRDVIAPITTQITKSISAKYETDQQLLPGNKRLFSIGEANSNNDCEWKGIVPNPSNKSFEKQLVPVGKKIFNKKCN